MNNPAQNKVAQSVLGPVAADDLGITLPHEHLLLDLTIWYQEPELASDKPLASGPVRMEILGWLLYNQYNNLDNMLLSDEGLMAEEVAFFKQLGGRTVVDVTTVGLGRDVVALKRIAQATGLNIIAGSGYYVLRGDEAKAFDEKSEDEIVEEMISDVLEGIGNTGIRAGILGEIGCSSPLHDREKKSPSSGGSGASPNGCRHHDSSRSP